MSEITINIFKKKSRIFLQIPKNTNHNKNSTKCDKRKVKKFIFNVKHKIQKI